MELIRPRRSDAMRRRATGPRDAGYFTGPPIRTPYHAGMQVGLVLPMNDADSPGAGSWPRVAQLARFAEAGGIDSLWVYDHFVFRFPGEPEDGIHEAWTLLTAVAR